MNKQLSSSAKNVDNNFSVSKLAKSFEDAESEAVAARKTELYRYYYKYDTQKPINRILIQKGEEQIYHTNGVHALEAVDFLDNPHQAGANLRAFYEWKNVRDYADINLEEVRNERMIIDVGASKRLINTQCLDVVGLAPIKSFGDYIRQSKSREMQAALMEDRRLTRLDLLEYASQEKFESDDLLIFTDSIYYINDNDLYTAVGDLTFGVVGAGSLHIPSLDSDGLLRLGDKVFGRVHLDGKLMEMQVNGNPEPYEHPIRFQQLVYKDLIELNHPKGFKGDYTLWVMALDRFDFAATIYTRFCIVKVPSNVKPQGKFNQMTLYRQNNLFRNDKKVEMAQLGITQGESVELLDSRGQLSIEHVNTEFNPNNRINIVNVNGTATVYARINDKVKGITLNKISPKHDGVWASATHFIDDLKNAVQGERVFDLNPDFCIPADLYNRLVAEFLKCKTLTQDNMRSIVLLARMNLPSASMIDNLVPIVASAMKDAYGVDKYLYSLLDSDLARSFNAFKCGEQMKKKCGLFQSVASWMFSIWGFQ